MNEETALERGINPYCGCQPLSRFQGRPPIGPGSRPSDHVPGCCFGPTEVSTRVVEVDAPWLTPAPEPDLIGLALVGSKEEIEAQVDHLRLQEQALQGLAVSVVTLADIQFVLREHLQYPRDVEMILHQLISRSFLIKR